MATREPIQKADDRTRTDNLLITNQLLCQLSHIGILINNDGTNRARTCDPLLVRQVLSQLSYDPMHFLCSVFTETTQKGLEPSTSAVTGRRSNQLSHRAIESYIPSKLHTNLKYLPSYFLSPSWLCPRPISNSQLHTLPCFHLCPINLVVFKGSYYFRMGYLILRGASRLDAFSVYPFPTWLLGHALGRTTDTPEVSPSRSSRTKDSSSQISYARAG